MVEKVIRGGLVAVLYSPGYGAGWSTWEGEYEEEILYSPEAVAWVEGGKEGDLVLPEHLSDVYMGGADQLEIKWLPEGTAFQIDEYDGWESLFMRDDSGWFVA